MQFHIDGTVQLKYWSGKHTYNVGVIELKLHERILNLFLCAVNRELTNEQVFSLS